MLGWVIQFLLVATLLDLSHTLSDFVSCASSLGTCLRFAIRIQGLTETVNTLMGVFDLLLKPCDSRTVIEHARLLRQDVPQLLAEPFTHRHAANLGCGVYLLD